MPRISDARREEQRSRIIQAALHAFAEHGFRGASMSKIIKRSGMSAGAIYSYFETKEDLELAVADGILKDRAAAMAAVRAHSPLPPPAKALQIYLDSLPMDLSDHAILLQVWGEAVTTVNLRIVGERLLSSTTEEITSYLTDWFVEGRGLGADEASAKARMLAPVVVGICQGYIVRLAITGTRENTEYFTGIEALLAPLVDG